jgi:hypothetical protein
MAEPVPTFDSLDPVYDGGAHHNGTQRIRFSA